MRWRRIETAPRTAETVLVYCEFCDMVNAAYWGGPHLNGDAQPPGWYWVWWESGETDCYPTHWMPLPQPPG